MQINGECLVRPHEDKIQDNKTSTRYAHACGRSIQNAHKNYLDSRQILQAGSFTTGMVQHATTERAQHLFQTLNAKFKVLPNSDLVIYV